MTSLDRQLPKSGSAQRADAERASEVRALWSALRAERRALDERTARLRMMMLVAGEDTGA